MYIHIFLSCNYIHDTQSAQILQKQDEYNMCNHLKQCTFLVMWAQETNNWCGHILISKFYV